MIFQSVGPHSSSTKTGTAKGSLCCQVEWIRNKIIQKKEDLKADSDSPLESSTDDENMVCSLSVKLNQLTLQNLVSSLDIDSNNCILAWYIFLLKAHGYYVSCEV